MCEAASSESPKLKHIQTSRMTPKLLKTHGSGLRTGWFGVFLFRGLGDVQMKDGVGRFASFTLGVANSAAQSASRTRAPRRASPQRTHDFKVRSDGSHAAVTANTKIQLFEWCSGRESAEMNSSEVHADL